MASNTMPPLFARQPDDADPEESLQLATMPVSVRPLSFEDLEDEHVRRTQRTAEDQLLWTRISPAILRLHYDHGTGMCYAGLALNSIEPRYPTQRAHVTIAHDIQLGGWEEFWRLKAFIIRDWSDREVGLEVEATDSPYIHALTSRCELHWVVRICQEAISMVTQTYRPATPHITYQIVGRETLR